MAERDRTIGILLMVLAAFCFSLMWVFSKALQPRVPAMEIVFARALASFLILAPWMAIRRVPFTGKNQRGLILRGVFGCLSLSLGFYAVARIHIATASMLSYTSPIFVALLSIFILKEEVTLKLILYVATAFIGAGLIVKPGTDVANLAGLAGLLSGFFAALAYVTIKRLHETEAELTIVFYFSWVTMALALVFAASFVWPTLKEALYLLLIGLFGTVAQVAITASYKRAPATVVSPFAFSNVLFSAVWGFLFWSEIPDLLSLAGGCLIVSCGIGIVRLKGTPAAGATLEEAA